MHVQHFTLPTAHNYGPVIDQMLRLRHRIFVEGAGWQIPQWKDREADAYDTALWTNYFVLFDDAGIVRATGRNIRCDHPYMLKEIWPELLYGAPAPSGPRWAEGSRMCVDPDVSRVDRALFHGAITLAAMEWAAARGVENFCFVSYPWALGALEHMGLKPQSYGPAQSFPNGEEFLAGFYPIGPEWSARVRQTLGIEGQILRNDQEELAA